MVGFGGDCSRFPEVLLGEVFVVVERYADVGLLGRFRVVVGGLLVIGYWGLVVWVVFMVVGFIVALRYHEGWGVVKYVRMNILFYFIFHRVVGLFLMGTV
jgi:hypothetical protein